MAWIKSATARRETEWVQVDDSLTGAWGRSALVFLRDGLIAGLRRRPDRRLFGLAGNAGGRIARSGRIAERGVPIRSAQATRRPSSSRSRFYRAPVVITTTWVQTRTDGSDRETANGYMPKWDVGFSAAQRLLTFRLLCRPTRPDAAAEHAGPALRPLKAPRLLASRPHFHVARQPTPCMSYSASLYITGGSIDRKPDRALPVGQWRMTVDFPPLSRSRARKFWCRARRASLLGGGLPIPLS